MRDKRNSARRGFERPAWAIFVPRGAPQTCVLRDISKTGARVRFTDAAEIPASFVLHLADNGTVARKCVVVWRSDNGQEIGVEFVARLVTGAARQRVALPA
jgi:hypothetical protein